MIYLDGWVRWYSVHRVAMSSELELVFCTP